MSKKSFALLIITAMLIAILAGFFASTRPDGLEKVAGKLGFEHKAKSTSGIFADYQLPALTFPAVSTSIAGIFGIILIMFIFRSISKANYIGDIIKKLLNLR